MKRTRRLGMEQMEIRAMLNAAPVSMVELATDRWTFLSNGSQRFQHIVHDKNAYMAGWSSELFADFTGDGVVDVLGRQGGLWRLHVNDGTQFFVIPWNTPGDEQLELEAQILGTGDFDNDGLLDVLSRDQATGALWVSINSDAGMDNQPWGQIAAKENQGSYYFIDDFDGDGLVDLLTGEQGSQWWLAKNTGSGFQPLRWGHFADYGWVEVVSGEFSGDGMADVAAMAPDRTWWVWQGTASEFQRPQYWGHWKMRPAWFNVGVGDFNNDGRDDIIGRTEDHRVWVGASTDTRFHTWTWATGWLHDADWQDVQIIDMNGDGLMDQVGHAGRDHTWWYGLNSGAKFQNHFWGRASGTDWTFVNDFQRETAVNVSGTLLSGSQVDVPGSLSDQTDSAEENSRIYALAVYLQNPPTSPSDEPPASHSDRPGTLRVSLGIDNRIVLTGTGEDLLGVDLTSPSGALLAPEGTSAVPFQLFVVNTPRRVILGNLGEATLLDGSLTLEVRWNVDAGTRDLEARYGLLSDYKNIHLAMVDPLLSAPS